jgi:transposase InsO family protein
LGISKKAYYTSRAVEERLDEKYSELKAKVKLVIAKHPAYGYRRIQKALLDEHKTRVNHKLLVKLLRIWGLSLKRKIKKKKYSVVKTVLNILEERANLVRRMVQLGTLQDCFQVLLTDVTEIPYEQGKAYLSVHMDYVGKTVLGWTLSKNATCDIAVGSFEMAKKALTGMGVDVSECIVHQDRGSINTSHEYVSCILKSGCTLSYSRKGKPGDNAVNESFFSKVKDEWKNDFKNAKDFNELQRLLKQAIEYYNNQRYHSSLGYQAPVVFTKNYLEKKKANLTVC